MARGRSPAATPQPPESVAVFIDTSLDTHLAVLVAPDDTIADLKGKIRMEHALSFPNFGEITVQSMKVRRRGTFYHLSDSMLASSAFSGTKGTWFLHMDAVSAGRQVETTKDTDKNIGHFQTHLLDMEPNGRFMNLSREGLSGDRCMPSMENEKKSDPDETEIQVPVCEGAVAVESHLQSKFVQVIDQGEKVAGEEDNVNTVLNANDVLFSIKKNKSKKRSNPVHGDQLLEKDASSVEKKKHKKTKDVPSEVPVEDPVANHGSYYHSKEMFTSEYVNPENSSPHLDNQLLEKNASLVEEKKHKKAKDTPSEEPVEDTIANHGSYHHSKEMFKSENVNPDSSSPHHTHSLQMLTKDDDKKKKRRKKEPSKLQKDIDSAIPETRPSDQLSSKTDAVISLGKQDATEYPQELLITSNKNLGGETDATFSVDKFAKNLTDGDSLELVAVDPLSLNLKGSNCNGEIESKVRLYNHEPGIEHTIQGQVTDADPQGTLGDKHADPKKARDALITLQEAATQRNPEEENPDVLINSRRSKKKLKSGLSRNVACLNDSLHSSGDNINKEKLEASGNNNKDLSKQSDVMSSIVEAVDHIDHTEGNPKVPSNADIKGSKRSRRKKSLKIELANPQRDNTYETVRSSGDQVTENILKDTSDDHFKDPLKISKDSTVVGGAAILGNHAIVDSEVLSNPNDRKSRRRKKKSTIAGLPNHESIDKDVHSLVKETTEEFPRETSEDGHKQQGEESKLTNIIGEAAVCENSALKNSTFPCPNDNNSSRRKEKTAELSSHDLILKEPIDSLVKQDTNAIPSETLEDSLNEQGKEAKSAILHEEAAVHQSIAGGNVANSSGNTEKISYQHKKKKNKIDFSSDSRSNYDLDHSSSNLYPRENLEKGQGTSHRGLGNEFNTGTAPDKTTQNLVHENQIAANSSGLPRDLSMENFVQHSTKEATEETTKGLLGNSRESSVQETTQEEKFSKSIEAKDHMEPPDLDSDLINFVEFFVPKSAGLASQASAQEHSYMEAETRKLDEEKTKRRKRKLNMHSEESANDLVNPSTLNEEDMLKKKPQDDDPGTHELVDPLVPLVGKESKNKRGKKTGGNRNFDTGAIRSKNDKNMLDKKHQASKSDTLHQVSLSNDDQSKNLRGKVSAVSKRKQSDNKTEGSTDGNQQPMNFDATIRGSPVPKSSTQNQSSSGADISLKGTLGNLAASSNSTEDTSSRKYKVAVRKVPSSRYGNSLSGAGQEKTLLATPGTIFDDATSESSGDRFKIYDRKASSKTISDNSSTSEDSDEGLDKMPKRTDLKSDAYMNSPGLASAAYAEHDGGTDEIILTQTSEVKKSKPLSKILRRTSSYRKAKLTASQSQVEDSESNLLI